MKKKITAAALALCLLLGLLPMSVLAAQYKGTLNGEEVTIDVDDTTGQVTLPASLAHYAASPDKLTVGSFPKTQDFALHYNGAPTGITISGTLVEAEDEPVVTVKPNVGDDGKVTVQDSDVPVTENTETVVLELQGNTDNGATVTIKADLVTSVKGNSVETVQVKTGLATADVPVAALPASGDATIAMTPAVITDAAIPAGTADAVKTAVKNAAKAVSVTVTDKDGKDLLPVKSSYAAADPTITITINGLVTGKTYVVLCLSIDGTANKLTSFGRFANITGSSINVKSKHLSAYIPVEETTENAAALAAVTEDAGKADGTVTPPATTVKVESVKTDIAPFTKVQVSGLKNDKVYLIRIGAGTGKAGQAVFYVDNATSYEFYCNADSTTGNQTVMVWELNSKADIAAGKMPAPVVTETVTKVS